MGHLQKLPAEPAASGRLQAARSLAAGSLVYVIHIKRKNENFALGKVQLQASVYASINK